jgi:hypothetical protein
MFSDACGRFFNSMPGRREFLRAGALPLVGLGLRDYFRGTASAKADTTQRFGTAKRCIILFMWGGPAHQDTWDMKPDAPAEFRGDFKSIATTVPGYRVCEHLPELAKRTNRLAIVRSMTHADVNHVTAPHFLLTGRASPKEGAPRAEDWPSIGAILAKLGRGANPLPPFVSMMPIVPDGAPRFVEDTHGQGAGWLGPLYQPMRIDADASKPNFRVGEFDLRADLSRDRANGRRALHQSLDRQIDRMAANLELQAAKAHHQRAFDLLSSPEVVRAFDMNREPVALRERYGINPHGQSVLLARRLAEAGVPLVTVFWPNDGIANVSVYWDTHNRNFVDLKDRLCPTTDKATSALLDDLGARGMLDDTLIVWTGEMGRTPRVGQSVVGGAGAGQDGRDHWPHVFTSILAGGGIKGGLVYGSSDRYAAYPAENPTRPADLAATIYHLLGVEPHMPVYDRFGRPQTLCEGTVINSLLA